MAWGNQSPASAETALPQSQMMSAALALSTAALPSAGGSCPGLLLAGDGWLALVAEPLESAGQGMAKPFLQNSKLSTAKLGKCK